MKVCFKCKQEKPLSEFYKHSQMSDGHLNKCKDCTKKDTIQNRLNKIEYYREYDIARQYKPHRLDYSKRRSRDYRKRNQEKYQAHNKINNAVRDGKLQKSSFCMICNKNKRLVGHHKDYSDPLNVMWVCYECHSKVHHKTQYKAYQY